METNIAINVTSAIVGTYDSPTPFEFSLGGHKAVITLTNIPRDMTAELEAAKRRQEQMRESRDSYLKQSNEFENKIHALERQVASTEESAPRSAVSDDTMKELLLYIKSADMANANSRIVVARLVTGWNSQRAQSFVATNGL
jgi:hypothetical protein